MKKFNKESYLKRLVIKKKLRNTIKYVYVIGISVLCLVLGLYLTYSKFFVKQEAEVIRTTVGDFSSGDVVIGAYLDGEYSSSIPTKSDGYTIDKVVCDNNTIGKFDTFNWQLKVSNITKKSKCNIYFKKLDSTYLDKIISQLDTTGKCPKTLKNNVVSVMGAETTNGYLCSTIDDYGETYYYRGNVTNNYVKFAGFYWRIVRVNGDGTIRMIYDGTSAHTNGESSTDRQIGKSAYNSLNNSNAYVGYMYGSATGTTYEETHTNINDSTVKAYTDNWYKNNLLNTDNEKYIADNIFCNDRSLSPNNSGTGASSSDTSYRWRYGPWNASSYMFLTCAQKNDAFTVSDTTNGNGALTYPIGLLTTDEIVLAGGWNTANSGYYLYSGNAWMDMSAYDFRDYGAGENRVDSNGSVNCNTLVSSLYAVRPVLNVKTDILEQGDGTKDNPYHLTLNS